MAKMGIWGKFQGLTEAAGEGGGSKNSKIKTASFMDALMKTSTFFLSFSINISNPSFSKD